MDEAVTTARDTRQAPGRSLLIWAVLAIIACVVVWLVMALRHPPWWGLMDDHNHLLVDCAVLENSGLARFGLDFIQRDIISWGMVRVAYPLQVALLYCHSSPWLAAIENLIFAVLTTWLFFWSVVRALVRWVPCCADLSTRLAAAIGTLSCLAFPWYHDFLLHVSLQEKTVLFGIAVTGSVLFAGWAQALKAIPFSIIGGLLLLGGLALKGQFAISLPLLVGMQLSADLSRGGWRAAWRTLALALWGLLGALAIKMVGVHGPYTSRYTLARGWQNLAHPFAWLVAVAALALLAHAGWRWRRHRDRPSLVVDLSLAACLLAYLVVLAPVGWRYYVIAFAAPWLALPWVLWWVRRPGRQVAALIAVTAVCALVVTGHRTSRVLTSKQDLRRIVESPLMAELADRGEALRVPCEEGSVAMRHYLQAAHASPPAVRGPEAPWPPPASAVVFHDAYMCPLGQRAQDLAMRPREVLLAPSFAGSYTVERYNPAAAP